jgi:hypothetical protein
MRHELLLLLRLLLRLRWAPSERIPICNLLLTFAYLAVDPRLASLACADTSVQRLLIQIIKHGRALWLSVPATEPGACLCRSSLGV